MSSEKSNRTPIPILPPEESNVNNNHDVFLDDIDLISSYILGNPFSKSANDPLNSGLFQDDELPASDFPPGYPPPSHQHDHRYHFSEEIPEIHELFEDLSASFNRPPAPFDHSRLIRPEPAPVLPPKEQIQFKNHTFLPLPGQQPKRTAPRIMDTEMKPIQLTVPNKRMEPDLPLSPPTVIITKPQRSDEELIAVVHGLKDPKKDKKEKQRQHFANKTGKIIAKLFKASVQQIPISKRKMIYERKKNEKVDPVDRGLIFDNPFSTIKASKVGPKSLQKVMNRCLYEPLFQDPTKTGYPLIYPRFKRKLEKEIEKARLGNDEYSAFVAVQSMRLLKLLKYRKFIDNLYTVRPEDELVKVQKGQI